MKMDHSGDSLWVNIYEGTDSLSGITITELSDGSFACKSNTQNNSDFGTYIFKINERGEIIWEQSYDFQGRNSTYGIVETNDDGLVVVGEIESSSSNYSDAFLFKVK